MKLNEMIYSYLAMLPIRAPMTGEMHDQEGKPPFESQYVL
jgi:hypothetical protein